MAITPVRVLKSFIGDVQATLCCKACQYLSVVMIVWGFSIGYRGLGPKLSTLNPKLLNPEP